MTYGMIDNVGFLFNKRIHLARRSFWGTLLLIGTSYSLYTIAKNCSRFITRPTSIRTETRLEITSGVLSKIQENLHIDKIQVYD